MESAELLWGAVYGAVEHAGVVSGVVGVFGAAVAVVVERVLFWAFGVGGGGDV